MKSKPKYECFSCHGTGQIQYEKYGLSGECPVCRGDGYTEHKPPESYDWYGEDDGLVDYDWEVDSNSDGDDYF